ncbi:MAG: hypothetical protein HQ488_02140 [Parcubacteria group bacterium]|nr:hypothetical protein [Parcubacteria group bacterium]
MSNELLLLSDQELELEFQKAQSILTEAEGAAEKAWSDKDRIAVQTAEQARTEASSQVYILRLERLIRKRNRETQALKDSLEPFVRSLVQGKRISGTAHGVSELDQELVLELWNEHQKGV